KTLDESNNYHTLIKTYRLLSDKIEDFEQLCTKVRRGDKNAKSNLSRKIVEHFGREGLAILMTANEVTLSWAHEGLVLANKMQTEPSGDTQKLLDDEMRAIFLNVGDNDLTENLYKSFALSTL